MYAHDSPPSQMRDASPSADALRCRRVDRLRRRAAAGDVAIRLERPDQDLPGRQPPRGRRPRPDDPRGRAGRAGGAVGLRQDHHAQDDQPPDRAHRRHGVARAAPTSARCRCTSCAGASATSSSRPGCSPTARCATTSPPSPSCSGWSKDRIRDRVRRAGRAARPRPRPARPLPGGACRADSSSGWAWPGRSPPTRRCC